MIKVKSAEPLKHRSNTELLNMYVSENNDVLQTDGKKLFCKICKKSISFQTKYLVYRHLKSKKHQKIIAGKESATESKSLGEMTSAAELLNKYLSDNTGAFKRDGEMELLILQTPQDFCKTCMKQFSKTKKKDDKENITDIPTGCQNNTNLMELLISVQPQIKVVIKDNIPTFMCSGCVQMLKVTYEFIEMYRNSDKKLRKILEKSDEHEEQMEEIEVNKYVNEIDGSKEAKYEKVTEPVEVEDEPVEIFSENENIFYSNHNNDVSDDKNNCLNISHKNQNSDDDDATRKVFKGFFQPEENEDGSLTCELCESVLDGVLPWREHIRQNHLEERPKRAYNRRTNKPRKKGTQKVSRKILPNEKGLYQCEYCEKSYPKFLFYRRHLRTHTEGTHLCIECGKSFSNITSYNSHMLRHKGEKKFECSQCPKSFVCPSDLYGHMMTHTSDKPYVCEICGSGFRMPYQLRNHNRVHTDIKNYKCEYCDMRFKSRPNQICHMRTHTGEKPFHCKYCERAFAQSGDCVKHMRQHFGDNNVYQCDLCPLRFPLVRDLRAHFSSHKDDDDETRDRNLQARMEEQQNFKTKLKSIKPV